MIAFLAHLVVRKRLENAGKNGFLLLSNALGVEVFKCHINENKIMIINNIEYFYLKSDDLIK